VGALVSIDNDRQVLASSALGAVYLPVSAGLERLPQLAMGGFMRASWGPKGWLFNANRGESGCPVSLSLHHGFSLVHWAAEVAPAVSSLVGQGRLQLISNRNIPASPVLSVGEAALPVTLPSGKQIIRGTLSVNLFADATLAALLHGVCSNLAVHWLAVTQTVEGVV
jgi:hypothetical protein